MLFVAGSFQGVVHFDVVTPGASFSNDDFLFCPVFSSIMILDKDLVANIEFWECVRGTLFIFLRSEFFSIFGSFLGNVSVEARFPW